MRSVLRRPPSLRESFVARRRALGCLLSLADPDAHMKYGKLLRTPSAHLGTLKSLSSLARALSKPHGPTKCSLYCTKKSIFRSC